MSYLARRGLPVATAAAGLAALSAGLASLAFAAPAMPTTPDLLAAPHVPAAPNAGAGLDMVSELTAAPSSVSELPRWPELSAGGLAWHRRAPRADDRPAGTVW